MLEHLDRMEHLRLMIGRCPDCQKEYPAVAVQLMHPYYCPGCGGRVIADYGLSTDNEKFESRRVKFSCGFCSEELMEPIGRFCREYRCHHCGMEIRIPNYAELKAQAEAAVTYKVLVQRIDVPPSISCTSVRMRQEHRPIWEFRIKPISKGT